MFEIILLVALCGVFWRYGKEMGTGKWIMIGVFIGCWIGIAAVFPVPILPLIGSAVITSILGILLSIMKDKQKRNEMDNKCEIQNKGMSCKKCGKPIVVVQKRCFECGASLV